MSIMPPYEPQIWGFFIGPLIFGIGFTVDGIVHGAFRVNAENRDNFKFLSGLFLTISSLGELIFFYMEEVTFLTYTTSELIFFYLLIPLLSFLLGVISHLVLAHKFNNTKGMS